jgi:phosphatidylethanolamine/phosphatidyl-N-methylethanolamine N-methyltransferase
VTRDSFSRQPLEKVVSRYDRVARWYRFGERTILLAPGFRRRAVARIGLKSGERVVEIGCGTGRNLALLRDAVGSEGHVIGVDASAGMLAQAQKVVSRHGWGNVTLVCEDAAKLTLDEPVDAAYFSLSYSVLPERAPVLDRAWEAVRPGGRLVIMDAGIPQTRLGRTLAPLAEIVATVFPGDPYSQPWEDLARISDSVAVERFQLNLYFVCTARKPLTKGSGRLERPGRGARDAKARG